MQWFTSVEKACDRWVTHVESGGGGGGCYTHTPPSHPAYRWAPTILPVASDVQMKSLL